MERRYAAWCSNRSSRRRASVRGNERFKFAKVGADVENMDMSPSTPSNLPVSQHNIPAWDDVQMTMQGIFDRRYYTNHGPLAQQLEAELSETLGVKHAIAVTNATIGLIIAAKAVNWEGEALVSALAPRATKDAIRWAGLLPREVDVDPQTHQRV